MFGGIANMRCMWAIFNLGLQKLELQRLGAWIQTQMSFICEVYIPHHVCIEQYHSAAGL